MTQQRRYVRNSTLHILAFEYAQASLPEEGSGEYDPSFVITKLGAKVNRALVCGVIDRMERREGDAGTSYTGVIRDPTGTHLFNIAPFQPELHVDAEEMLNKFESGERFLLMLVGRARWYETDDNSIFTSLRADEFAIVERNRYIDWLIEASDSTLRRINAYQRTIGLDLNAEEYKNAEIPEDMIEGLILSKGHYPEFDTEDYLLAVRQSLSLATGRSEINYEEPEIESQPISKESSESDETPTPNSEPLEMVLDVVRSRDSGNGVDYNDIVAALVNAGHSREAAEDAIDSARDQGEVMEPRFGFFQLVPE